MSRLPVSTRLDSCPLRAGTFQFGSPRALVLQPRLPPAPARGEAIILATPSVPRRQTAQRAVRWARSAACVRACLLRDLARCRQSAGKGSTGLARPTRQDGLVSLRS